MLNVLIPFETILNRKGIYYLPIETHKRYLEGKSWFGDEIDSGWQYAYCRLLKNVIVTKCADGFVKLEAIWHLG